MLQCVGSGRHIWRAAAGLLMLLINKQHHTPPHIRIGVVTASRCGPGRGRGGGPRVKKKNQAYHTPPTGVQFLPAALS